MVKDIACLLLMAAAAVLMAHVSGCGGVVEPGDDATGSFIFEEDSDPLLKHQPFKADEVMARLAPGARFEDARDAVEAAGATIIEREDDLELLVLSVAPDDLHRVAGELSSSAIFDAVQKNYLIEPQQEPNDRYLAEQWHVQAIGLPAAWDIATGDGMLIAVLDTGVEESHPDLRDRLLAGRNTFDGTSRVEDPLGHGTAVAGVIGAATNNSAGVAGTNWSADILPIRVANASGQASSSSIALGMVWAIREGASITNISFAPLASDRIVLRAAQYVRRAGGLVFISAGNDAQTYSSAPVTSAIFVGAVDDSSTHASFSTSGPFVDLSAPGVDIYTTNLDGTYEFISGTSFAAPLTAGVASLVWAANPDLSPQDVEDVLKLTAVDRGATGRDDAYGEGVIDAAAAVTAAGTYTGPIDDTPPAVSISSPRTGDTVSGYILISTAATDDVEVDRVELLVDGVLLAGDTSAPFRFAMNTRLYADGAHTLTAVSVDTSENHSSPASVEIIVANQSGGSSAGADSTAPTVTMVSPADEASVSGSFAVRATATDNAGLASAALVVDGQTLSTVSIGGTSANVSILWDSAQVASGSHQVGIRVTDTAGLTATSSITVSTN